MQPQSWDSNLVWGTGEEYMTAMTQGARLHHLFTSAGSSNQSRYRNRLVKKSDYEELLLDSRGIAFGSLPHQNKPLVRARVTLPSINCLFPLCPTNRSDWGHHFLQKARGQEGIKSRLLSAYVKRHKYPPVKWPVRRGGAKFQGQSLPDTRKQPPTWLHRGQDLMKDCQAVCWVEHCPSRRHRSLSTRCCLCRGRTAVVEAPDVHQNKYCLGLIFFQKTQASLKLMLLLDQLVQFYPREFLK